MLIIAFVVAFWQQHAVLTENVSYVKGVRFVGGVGMYDGFVEVLVGDTWDPVCYMLDFFFDDSSAPVFCRMKGLPYVTNRRAGRYNTINRFIGFTNCPWNAVHVNSCNYTTVYKCYYQLYVACEGFPLNINSIQLIDGSSAFDGRAELHVEDVIGTICQNNFEFEDAQVLCKMIGLNASLFNIEYQYNTSGRYPMIRDLRCSGQESHINNCTYTTPYSGYTCEEGAVKLLCTECGRVNVPYGFMELYNDTAKTLTVRCHNDSPTHVKYICENNGSWSNTEECRPMIVQDIRLVHQEFSPYLYRGTVELKISGAWGTICDNMFGAEEATVLCRMMNASYGSFTTNAGYGRGSGTVHVSNLICSGSEKDVSECSYQSSHTCNHSDDVGIQCTVSTFTITKIRLADGNSTFDGRLELFANGFWVSVCDMFFTSNIGEMFCRMMNLTYIQYKCCSRHGDGAYLLEIDSCPLLATHIDQCFYYPHASFCPPSRTVSLVCSECPVLIVPGGSVTYSLNGTVATPICNAGFSSNVTVCQNGQWSPPNIVCSRNPPLNITDVRLVDGPGPNVGRVEIAVDGVYGTICDSNFDYNDADMICKSVNSRYRTVYIPVTRYGNGSGPVHIDQLHCDGAEASLDECLYVQNGQCSHSEDVSLLCNECGKPDIFASWSVNYFQYNGTSLFANCEFKKTYVGYLRMICTANGWTTIEECQEYSYPLYIQEIRLVDGNSTFDGRVEIKVFNTWGTVCNDLFGIEEANVICKMIGFYSAEGFRTSSIQGTGPVYVDNMACDANSSHINDCQYSTYHDCSHSEDVAVTCTGITAKCVNPTPQFGSVNDTSTNVGSSISVACERGRILVGDSVIVCKEDGNWTSAPFCRLIDCGDPTPDNGEIKGTSYYLDDVVSVSCDTGYILSGDAVITCQNNSYWTDDPTCTIVDCNALTIANMTIDIGNTTTYGQIAVVKCKYEFSPSGSWAVKCEANGVWNYTHVPDCKLIDCGSSAPIYGRVNDTTSTIGTVVGVECDYGRHLVGDAVLVCQQNGKWSGSPFCSLIECDDPTPNNGFINGTSHYLDDVLSVSCVTGFSLSGHSVIRCQNNSRWTDYPHCTIVDCGVLHISAMSVNIGNATTYGQIADVRCHPDFKPLGSWTVKCEASGIWNYSLVPQCELIDCGDPTPSKGLVNSSKTTVNTVVRVSCENGYTLSGESVITCLRNGTWSGKSICDSSDCGRPAISNADVVTNNSTTLYSKAFITCNDGFEIQGPSIIICTQTGWSDNVTCSPIVCEEMEVENGSVIGAGREYGAVIEVKCHTGYIIRGDNKLTCQGKGHWSDKPACVIQNCGIVTVPTNGIILTSPVVTTFNSSLRFQCNDGYHLTGNGVLWCDANGKWDSSVPTCVRKYCDNPTPTNGVVNGTSFYFSDVVSVSCENGFLLSGEPIIQCQNNSNWTVYPRCNIVVCERIDLQNGTVTGSETHFGSIIEVKCDIGYDLRGDSRLVCQADGHWSGNPTCISKDCGNVTLPNNMMILTSPIVTTFNSSLRFKCQEDYLLTGNDVIWCSATGTWNSSFPTCIQKSDVGGPCADARMCKTISAICEDKKCSCMTGVVDRRTQKCDIMSLLPFGEDNGDVIMDQHDCSESIVFSHTIPVFNKMRQSMHVCRCGLVSFDKKYSNNKPVPAGKGKLDIIEPTVDIKDPVVAAYFADIFVDKSSSITFRTYDILNNYPFTAKATEDIAFLESLIKRVENISSFDASFVLIATWSNVKAKATALNRNNHATFQLAIVSNGVRTYSVTIYGNELMNWDLHSKDKTIPIWIGHAGENGTIFNHVFSFKTPALRMDLGSKSGGISGLLLKNIDENISVFSHHGVDCIKWYNKNSYRKQDIQYYSIRLPMCPCDVDLARWDPWFWPIRAEVRQQNNNDSVCVDMILGEAFKPHGKSCCYYRSTLTFVDMQPLSGGFYFSHPSFSPRNHEANDVIMKDKCCMKSNFCDLYYRLHPTGPCYTESPYRFGSFWGDPHMSTLDGMNYTFNGLGEYVLLSIETSHVTFSLQARTERAVKEDGNLSDATIFTAFAARDNTNSSIHVELNKAKDNVTLYGNGIDLTKTLREVQQDMFVFNTSTLTIHEDDGVLRVSFLEIGITLEIGQGAGMLSLDAIVPNAFSNVTKGLLGNFDRDPFNDFVYPNGSQLHFNASDMEIFFYGQAWSVNDSSSVFLYDDGKEHSDYHNASYIPRFLDTVDKVTLAEAEKACNGSKNKECVFDYALTLNENIAMMTNRKRQSIDVNTEEIAQIVPTINNTCSVIAKVGEQISCRLKLDDGLDIEVLNNVNKTATYNRTSKTLYFRQKDDLPHNIWFVAINADRKQSQQHTIQVQLCTGCRDNGRCSTTVRPDPRENAYFKYSACVCDPGYTGDDCDKLYDWCAERPCTFGRNCTSLPSNKTYLCSPCPNGYAAEPGTNDCIDMNECNSSNPCDHTCLNTEGSYSCDCEQGFRVDANNKHKCIDINECNEASHNCTQICKNTIGSFFCRCQLGFTFDMSNWTCVPDDSDPCANSTLNCTQTAGCTFDTNNATTCFCDAGFIFNKISHQCQDVNECSQHICAQDCTNTIGSFQCSCIAGYQLINKVSCELCEVPNWGLNCSQTCDCTGRGAERCDPVRGCVCSNGWTGSSCDDDVDECKEHPGVCEDARKSCTNNIGSYRCDCLKGYVKDAVGNCRDIDECSDPLLNECSQTCLNAEGSYTCGCKHGYTEVNSTHCTDINECDLNLADCEQMCENHPGYYNCYCYFGYRLNDDRNTCSKVKDFCKELNNLTCAGYCEVRNKTASCQCQQGFELAPDKQNCADVDECEDGNKCSTGANCMNTVGSFVCECPVGMKLQNNKRTCKECDNYHYGKDCSLTCSCINGVCNSTVGCVCGPGWTGISCDVDVDECRNNQVVCNETNTHCLNTRGSASCVCQEGYTKNIASGKCEDMNECQTSFMNTCDQDCINTPGSYLCSCREGFVFKNGKCNDINECLGGNECQQQCVNTIGSYRCSCESGFVLELTDRKSCIAETKCTLNQAANCSGNATCSVSNDEVICVCPNGYNGTYCTDIDECENGKETCDQNCNNTIGGYNCECQVGYFLENDNATCTECMNWTYGEMCSRECKCNLTNTETCNPTNGNCTCFKGWHGGLCNDDVNECTSTPNECPTNSQCINLSGSFTCECDAGHLKNSSGLCQACPQGRFGKGCTSTCLCDMAHTSVCNPVNGSCTCDAGWTGPECKTDVDECVSANGFKCPANSTCVDAIGSYKCDCDPGFKMSSKGDSCTECSDNTYGSKCFNTCACVKEHTLSHTQSCDTINGTCKCTGNWTGNTCQIDVDECQEDVCKDQNAVCVNTDGSYACYCKKGFVKDDVTKTCSNVATVPGKKIDLQVTLKIEDRSVNLTSDRDFAVVAEKVTLSLRIYLMRFITNFKIVINDLRNGSLVVDFTLVYDTADGVTKVLVDLANGTNFTYDRMPVKVISEQLSNATVLCGLYEKIRGPCEYGTECNVTGGVPSCVANIVPTDNVKLIIGVSVAGGLILGIGIFTSICIVIKRKARNAEKHSQRRDNLNRYNKFRE
ncbi:uncharacterized protein LOC127848005 isoform X4 [Dreissena polymorpha]|uniref:uncharacterized protein LOC127848005 isoform X4 n=1 Tax=Dreissena polymorpha TaxID=45954 RepID=UPI002264D894|nr:uncharacterized protein LOC127848005 isoform X4 [Dreissena polymorpha]